MKRVAIGSLGLVVLLAGAYALRGPTTPERTRTSLANVTSEKPAEPQSPKPAVAVREASRIATPKTQALPTDPNAVARERFQELNAKTLLTAAERDERQRMLNDRDLIASLPKVLCAFAADPKALVAQDSALDLLGEALKTGDHAAAEKAMNEIVVDRQIEDLTRAESEREQLAGVKGEVLYRLLVAAPDEARRLEQELPGEASRTVWENVLKVQADSRSAPVAMTGEKEN